MGSLAEKVLMGVTRERQGRPPTLWERHRLLSPLMTQNWPEVRAPWHPAQSVIPLPAQPVLRPGAGQSVAASS